MSLVVLIVLAWALVTVAVIALCGMAKRGDRAMQWRVEATPDARHASRVRRGARRTPAAVSRRAR